jgi:acyl carrier protein
MATAPVESPERATGLVVAPGPHHPRLSSIHVTAPPGQGLDSVAAMLADPTHCFDEERVGRVLAIAREVLSEPDISPDDELADHGGTSLAIVRIIAVTSRTLGLDIQPRDLDGTVTVRNLARVARRPLEAGS